MHPLHQANMYCAPSNIGEGDTGKLYKNDLHKVRKIMKEVIGKKDDSRKQDLEMCRLFIEASPKIRKQ